MTDYLWDKTGSDPEVERLERLLQPLASRPARPRTLAPFSMAAALMLALTALLLSPADESWFNTAEQPRTLRLEKIGTVRVEPQTRLRILEAHRLRLERGTIQASIGQDVRPRLFQVETPATTCVDLGCKYVLTVDEAGRSFVRVLTGRVAFVDGPREVYIPAGAACRAQPGRGSGTPYWEDASTELIQAIQALDAAADRPAAARRVAQLVQRPKDTLTLWHFLHDPALAPVGLDALVKIVPAPAGIPRELVLRQDAFALFAWKEHLEEFWR
jgi:hypothetical protein